MKYAFLVALAVLSLSSVSTAAARNAEVSPASTVRAFYHSYFSGNVRVGDRLASVRGLFEPALYNALHHSEAGLFEANVCPGYIDVSRCPYVTFDPFSYARARASSYSIGSEHRVGDRVFVPVALRISGQPPTASHITFVVTLLRGRYTISGLLYPKPRYYNFGPIVDLRKFLMLTGAMPLDAGLQRGTTSALGVVRAFYGLYVASGGHVEKNMLQTKAFLESSLFENISSSYETGGGFSVSSCSACNNTIAFDPFANSPVPASSYVAGAPQREGTNTLVPVVLRFSGKRPATASDVTVVVHQRGASYAIGDIRYNEPRYYYGSAIDDLRTFLSKWNC
jgi:hypothetical protein